ncbi:MAG: M1 family metallopeptidase [Actinomycetota bacterium]|nr:M1 family metallopeptidase [Actinomycetota bacterium]
MRVRSILACGVVVVSLLTSAPAAAAVAIVRNPGNPGYDVHLRTGRLGHAWTGSETVTFTNVGAVPLADLWIRLWSNGVVGCSALAIEATLTAGGTQEGGLAQDCTALHVTLDDPVASGADGSLAMDLRIEVPERNDRFGHHDGLTYVGTALPTLAINDDDGWHLDPFVDIAESFYSVVGDYRVVLGVPVGMDTPTTGTAAATTTTARRRVTTYEAEDVRDFEWAAGDLTRRAVTAAGGTRIRVWYLPRQTSRNAADRALTNAVRAMRTFSDAFGPFPYPEMDVVLSAFTSFGGMEYPTIVFTNPDRLTVAHELAHQWWYGIVGDDQFDEPWLDESFATWSMYLPFGPWVGCRIRDWPSPTVRLTADMAYWDTHRNQYWVIYSQGGCMLANLAGRFGRTRFLEILHGYADANRLGIARTEDFQATIESAAATDLPGFDAVAFWDRWRVWPD